MWTNEEWQLVGVPVVERAKREVLEDVSSGRVPANVADFAALHDHVDANGYGGAFEDGVDVSSDEGHAFWCRVQNEVDLWIRTGGIADTLGAGDVATELANIVEYLRFHTAEAGNWNALLPEYKSVLQRCEAAIAKRDSEVANLRTALRNLLVVVDHTAEQLEEASPGAAECGYWSRHHKDAYELAKALVK